MPTDSDFELFHLREDSDIEWREERRVKERSK